MHRMSTLETNVSDRAKARSAWPVRAYALGEEPNDDLSSSTTAEERLAMMWPLARAAWSLAGLTVPDYPRSQAPGRVIRSRA